MASAVAVRLAQRAGLTDLQLIFFRAPFFRNEEGVARMAQALRLPLRFITVKREFLRLPRAQGDGFPCALCRQVLLERAARLLRRRRFDVLLTGEIAGRAGLTPERLRALEEAVGLAGRVVRPLSAQLFPPTLAEAEGAVRREVFLGLSHPEAGKAALGALAQDLGVPGRPAGRVCLLANPVFAQRCRMFGQEGSVVFTANFVELLEFPHLFRLPHGAVLVVATSPPEQVRLQDLFLPEDVRLYVPWPGSPLGLLRGPWARLAPEARDAVVELAAQKLVELSGLDPGRPWTVCVRREEAEETGRIRVAPCTLRSELSPVN